MVRPRQGAKPDPWSEVDDLEGDAHYRALGLRPDPPPSAAEIRASYRARARELHPDKGGDPEEFARLREAFTVLGDPEARAAYDAWGKELRWRHLPGVAPRAPGGHGLMLDEFERQGLSVDPATQLVLTCEVCRRPSTCQCWTCGMRICEFCTLKRHWKGRFGLHWPVVNQPGKLARELGRRELEAKRLEDAERLALEDPHHKTQTELDAARAYKEAAFEAVDRLGAAGAAAHYDLRLARHYMWAQTTSHAYVACYCPDGDRARELYFEASEVGLKLQVEGSPPLLARALRHPLSREEPIETFRASDRRYLLAALPKGVPGEAWEEIFEGDPRGARALEPPYALAEAADEVALTLEVPFWIEEGDVAVDITGEGLEIAVRGWPRPLRKAFWQKKERDSKEGAEDSLVDAAASTWFLETDQESTRGDGRCGLLTVLLAKRAPTEDEVRWHKGVRQDNLNTPSRGHGSPPGHRFFADDADPFGLEHLLEAACFLDAGESWVPRLPTEGPGPGKRVRDPELLPEEARRVLENLIEGEEQGEGESEVEEIRPEVGGPAPAPPPLSVAAAAW